MVRQADSSGILWNATHLRTLLENEDIFAFPKIRCHGFPDVRNISGNDLIEILEECYHRDGEDETIVVTRSNKRANIYNNGIRAKILWREELIEGGDMLMVAKNNYYWTKDYKDLEFLANGDMFEIERLSGQHEMYGFNFAKASLRSVDYNWEIEALIWLDTSSAECATSATSTDSLLPMPSWNFLTMTSSPWNSQSSSTRSKLKRQP